MKKILSIISLFLFLISSANAGKNVQRATVEPIPVPVAKAPIGAYIGVGALASFFTRDCCRGGKIHDNTYGALLRVGYNINRYVGIEGRFYTSPIEKDFMKITSYAGIFLKPQMPLGENITAYGLLGYGHTKISANCPGIGKHKHSISSPAFGGGVEYHFNKTNINGKRKKWSVWVDVINVMHHKTVKKFTDNVTSAGVAYHF